MTDEQQDPTDDAGPTTDGPTGPEPTGPESPGAEAGSGAPGGTRKLYRSRSDKVLGGVCGGLGDYFDIDPLIFRITWVVFGLSNGLGILAYIAACIFLPENPDQSVARVPAGDRRKPGEAGMIFGVLLVVLGAHFLAEELGIYYYLPFRFWYMPFETLAAFAFVALGGYLIYKGTGSRRVSSAASGSAGSAGPGATGQASTAQTSTAQASAAKRGSGRRFTRSTDDRKLAGVCGGIADYFGWDPTLVRLGFVVFTCATHILGILVYGVLALIMPEKSPVEAPGGQAGSQV